jgi:hypothetical protein
MSAVHALKLARSAGIRIGIDGDAVQIARGDFEQFDRR